MALRDVGDWGGRTENGVTPIIGLILLVGMILIGATLVALTGMQLVDSISSDAEDDQLRTTIDQIDHDLETVAVTDQTRELPVGGYDQIEATDEGSISVTWFDDEGTDPDDLDWSETASLGEIQLHSDRTAIVHQGGGIWENRNGEIGIHKSPTIEFNGDGHLDLTLMQIDPGEVDESPSSVQGNPEFAMETTERLATVAQNPEGDHFAVKIESRYADGWERHFENEADTDQNASVDRIETDDDAVVLTVSNMGDVSTPPHFLIEEDHGLAAHDRGTDLEDNLVERGDQFHVDTTLKNYGDEADTVNATLTILDGSDVVDERTIESRDELGHTETIETSEHSLWNWVDGAGQHAFDPEELDLTPGSAYEYDVETQNDSLDQRGTFYYLDEGVNYSVADTATEYGDGEIEISAAVKNIGAENGTENVTLEIDREDSTDAVNTSTEVELDRGQAGTLTWPINESAWSSGEYEYTVQTPHDEDEGTFEVTAGGAFEITEELGIPEGDRVGGTEGQIISDATDVTLRANVTNTHNTSKQQEVNAEIFDEDGEIVEDAATIASLDGGETETVSLTTDPLDAGTVYEYSIATEDDELDERGSFLAVEQPSQFAIDDVTVVDDPVKPDDSLTVDVVITNEGNDGEDVVWLEGFDGNVVDAEELELGADETTTVSMQWKPVEPPASGAETKIGVGTTGDDSSATVDIEPALFVDDVEVVDDPVVPGDTVTVEASVESVTGDASQDVVLEGFDGDVVDSKGVTVEDGEADTLELEYETDSDSITDRVEVRTDDDVTDGLVVLERDGPVCGEVDYDGSGTEDDPHPISTVDELQCINDHDLDAHYELVDDIDAQGTEFWNDGKGFEPIGPTGNSYTTEGTGDWDGNWETFGGEFDGNGHQIDGLYIERPDEEFVGLFGATNYPRDSEGGHFGEEYDPGEGSTIQNVRLANVYVHGERHVGGLVGQAGGTIKDSRSEGAVRAEYQLVGGLVGDGAHADLDNRLVAEGTVSGGDYRHPTEVQPGGQYYWNRGIGGLIGRSTWETDVSTGYTDVEVNGPSMIGGIVGSSSNVESNFTQMYTVAELTIQSDSDEREQPEYQGAVAGTIENDDDAFQGSVYHDESPPHAEQTYGQEYHTESGWTDDAIPRETEEMQGLDVDDTHRMDNLLFEEDGGPWVAIPDDYPRFAWELAAEGLFEVEINDVEEVTAGEAMEVDVTVTSRYEDPEETDVTQTIALTDDDGQTVDTRSVTLPSTLGEDETEEVTLVWQTDGDAAGTNDLTVSSDDREDTASTEVEEADHGPGDSDGPGLGDLPGDGDFGDDDLDLGPGDSDSSEDDVPDVHPDIDIDVGGIEIG